MRGVRVRLLVRLHIRSHARCHAIPYAVLCALRSALCALCSVLCVCVHTHSLSFNTPGYFACNFNHTTADDDYGM